jgi:hypothetical protein
VCLVIDVATEDWRWMLTTLGFILLPIYTLYRYYFWPRRIRRP